MCWAREGFEFRRAAISMQKPTLRELQVGLYQLASACDVTMGGPLPTKQSLIVIFEMTQPTDLLPHFKYQHARLQRPGAACRLLHQWTSPSSTQFLQRYGTTSFTVFANSHHATNTGTLPATMGLAVALTPTRSSQSSPWQAPVGRSGALRSPISSGTYLLPILPVGGKRWSIA